MLGMQWLVLLAKTIVATSYLYHGFFKLLLPAKTFERSIQAYRIFPQPLPGLLARFIPFLEILLGVLLLLQTTPMLLLGSSLMLLLCFQGAVGSALFRKLPIGCGCSGEGEHRQATLKQAFLRNWVLIGLLTGALWFQLRLSLQPLPRPIILPLTLLIVGATSASAVASRGNLLGRIRQTVTARPSVQSSVMNRRDLLAVLLGSPLISLLTAAAPPAPVPCDCSCIMYMVTTAPDCATYCPEPVIVEPEPGGFLPAPEPCYAPVYTKIAYYCCGVLLKSECDFKLTLDHMYKCR